jgi:hypothetical protein
LIAFFGFFAVHADVHTCRLDAYLSFVIVELRAGKTFEMFDFQRLSSVVTRQSLRNAKKINQRRRPTRAHQAASRRTPVGFATYSPSKGFCCHPAER